MFNIKCKIEIIARYFTHLLGVKRGDKEEGLDIQWRIRSIMNLFKRFVKRISNEPLKFGIILNRYSLGLVSPNCIDGSQSISIQKNGKIDKG